MDRMPNELIDRTIDFLHKDTKSLRSCSTVCRTWSLTARYHLFERVCVNEPGQLSSMQKSSAPLSSVKTLWAGPTHFFDEFVHFRYKRRFTNLSELTICGVYSPTLNNNEVTLKLCEELPLLQDLTLEGVEWFSLDHLMQFIHSFTLLSRLSIAHVTWETRSTSFLYDPSIGFPLRRLSMESIRKTNEFIDTFLHLHPSLQLQRFLVTPRTCGRTYQRICEASHATLENLNLSNLYPLTQVEIINIKKFTALITITLDLAPNPTPVIQALQRVTSDNIEHVLLIVRRWNANVWEGCTSEYGIIDDLMCTPRFKNAVLSIGVESQHLFPARAFFSDALPKLKLDDRARLRVENKQSLWRLHSSR